ncbi:BREX-2 system adenine-specific DNA-methyltransferase PglX [Streptomyces niveus]|uniref:BREX-2 system adenine-specific DNA-methyltransferase PglX n=1 Tax=Streptomyces niveus TaxID=193462 RepID=UPI0036760B47
MINRKRLLVDLQAQVAQVETDLHAQVSALPEVEQRLQAEHKAAFDAKRTAASSTEWIGERVTQAAVAWVLATVFVRFCEDNGLITNPYLAGPVAARQAHAEELHEQFMAEDAARVQRDWLLKSFSDLGAGQAGKLLFDPRHNPLYQIPISHDAAKELIDFWRHREENESGSTTLIHDFRDSDWDTRFLGDLYQDLSADARTKYALLQTPEFVEEFILDRTLESAIGEFGYDVVKIIDPTCGSGHFILGAFHRLLKAWEEKAPSVDIHTRVRGALDAVHGVDINPFAVAIARFRLLIAALKSSGIRRLRDASHYNWPLHIATGDALLKSEQLEMFEPSGSDTGSTAPSAWYTTEDISEHSNILTPSRYHVVVGNPPYITVKDKNLNTTYRRMYKYCSGIYQLTVPFIERFFELAIPGDVNGQKSGHVGQITSNAFMKREFGEKIIENYLASAINLTEVIDTSGAHIPDHGTPTVILIGRRTLASNGASTVRTVRSIQGEPTVPSDPAQGLVWRAIVDQVDRPNSNGPWVSSEDLNRSQYFGKHPWILAHEGLETVEAIESNASTKLKYRSSRIGTFGKTNADEAMVATQSSWTRRQCESRFVKPLFLGDQVRDWQTQGNTWGFFPYDDSTDILEMRSSLRVARWMWPNRTTLGNRATFSKRTYFADGRAWHEWSQVPKDEDAHLWTLTFAFVATHNHFSLHRTKSTFKNSVGVIKLRQEATELDHTSLSGLLNSSVACFWLKQMCHSKGHGGIGGGIASEEWEKFYEFNGTNVSEFPLPTRYPLARATELDSLAQQLSAVSPSALTTNPEKPPTSDLLATARDEWHRLRARMIAVQEELDWEVYDIYGLHDDLTAPVDSLPSPGLDLGQRAFEIELGRKVDEEGVKTEWFRRHNSTRISKVPAEWPEAYKETVERRLEAIRTSAVIGLVERPEYKRRWLTDGWDSQQHTALREWLLARMESRELWFTIGEDGVERPRTLSVSDLVDALADDSDFTDVADLYAPGKDLSAVVPELVADQHVPFLAALRYKEPVIKKKRSVWEQVWDMQRAEDDAADKGDLEKSLKIRDSIPVPPKYTTADFIKPSYAAQRGGLDVPKERFISYSRTLSPAVEVLGWGGWDHQEQALALVMAIEARVAGGTWEADDLMPYLAGLREVLPWVRQWHPEQADFYEEVLGDYQSTYAVTDEALRAWRPPSARGGGWRKPRKKPEPKPDDNT